MEARPIFGQGDASYRAAGELEGLTRLVEEFYQQMDRLPAAGRIRAMHPEDLKESKRKLVYFLSGWLGGPKLYKEHYGSIIIPSAHRHLDVNSDDADMWLLCMANALDLQPYESEFKEYLLDQLRVPATRIYQACGNF